MNGPKVAVIVLAVLALLFWFGLLLGARDGGRPDPADSWVDTLGGFIPKPDVPAGDIQADCLAGNTFTIPAAQACVAVVTGPDRGVREARLRVTSAASVTITAERPDVLSDERALAAGQERIFDVFSEGMRLTLQCNAVGLGAPPCVVTLE